MYVMGRLFEGMLRDAEGRCALCKEVKEITVQKGIVKGNEIFSLLTLCYVNCSLNSPT